MIFSKYIRVSWIKSFYVNFSCLPLRQAIYFPTLLSRHFELKGIRKGSIVIKDCKVTFGMVNAFSNRTSWMSRRLRGRISTENGMIILYGGNIKIQSGCNISASFGGLINIYGGVEIGPMTNVISRKQITIRTDTIIAWNCNILDTDFHPHSENNKDIVITKNIYIGEKCWLGNNVSILKGAFIPNGSIIGANSLFNSDKYNETNMLYVGSPSKPIKHNVNFKK